MLLSLENFSRGIVKVAKKPLFWFNFWDMTQVTLPISSRDFALDMPSFAPRKHNWMGRVVQWIRNAENQGLFHHALISTIAIIVSVALLCSVILSPLFVYGFKEFIRQEERALYEKKFASLLEIAEQNNRNYFLKGRLDPLSTLDISLVGSARKQMIKDLELPKKEAKDKTDRQLLLEAALKFDNYLDRYYFKVHSRSQWLFWRLLGY